MSLIRPARHPHAWWGFAFGLIMEICAIYFRVEKVLRNTDILDSVAFMTRLHKNRGITQVEEDKSLILRHILISLEPVPN